MSNAKWKYFIAGVILCLVMTMILSAGGGPPEKEVGRYQITAGGQMGAVFIVDTKTGVVKFVMGTRQHQLGIPFDEMAYE